MKNFKKILKNIIPPILLNRELVNFLKLVTKIYKYNYILFSPGGESFDNYKNYSDRGKKFNRLIKKIIF